MKRRGPFRFGTTPDDLSLDPVDWVGQRPSGTVMRDGTNYGLQFRYGQLAAISQRID